MSKNNNPTVEEARINREMGLSEVRARLISAIETLKKSSKLKSFSEKQLKDFWHKDYPAAPFEELFTFRQIAEINIDTFFKKRSVVPSKILGIVAAIESAIGNTTDMTGDSESADASVIHAQSLNKRVRLYEIEYNSLIGKCRKIIEVLKLANDSAEFNAADSKKLKSIDADLKKINKLLDSNQEKLSKLL